MIAHADADSFKVETPAGWVQLNFGWGRDDATLWVGEKKRGVVVKRIDRQSDDFDRLGRLLWPLYEKATADEWPASP